MKLQILIETLTCDQTDKAKILSQLLPATQKFGEYISPEVRIKLLHIEMDAENSVNEPIPDKIKEETKHLIRLGKVEINLEKQLVSINNSTVSMTPIEFKLLHILAKRQGSVQSRETLLKDVWNINPENNTRTLDVHIKRIRDKLGANIIQTVSGVGYVIQ